MLAVVLVCLATYRITRLLAADAFPPLARARDAIEDRWGDASWQAYLAHCPWCISVYTGALLTAAAVLGLDDGLAAPLLVWPTASAFTGLVATWLDD